MYGLPIKKIQFHTEHNHDLVLSMDDQVCTLTYPPTYLKYLHTVPTYRTFLTAWFLRFGFAFFHHGDLYNASIVFLEFFFLKRFHIVAKSLQHSLLLCFIFPAIQ